MLRICWLQVALSWLQDGSRSLYVGSAPKNPKWPPKISKAQDGAKMAPSWFQIDMFYLRGRFFANCSCNSLFPFQFPFPSDLLSPARSACSHSNTPFHFQFPFPLSVPLSLSSFPFPFQIPFLLLVPLSPSSFPLPVQFLSLSPSSSPSPLKLHGSSWGCMLTHVGSCWGYVSLRWPQAQAWRNGA